MGFLVGFIAMTFHAITANTFIIVRIMEPFWLLAGIVMVTPELEAEDETLEQEPEAEAKSPLPLPHRMIPTR